MKYKTKRGLCAYITACVEQDTGRKVHNIDDLKKFIDENYTQPTSKAYNGFIQKLKEYINDKDFFIGFAVQNNIIELWRNKQ